MDISSISKFLDLVSNPTKYKEFISLLEEREQRWLELVEAHGTYEKAAATKEAADKLFDENTKAKEELSSLKKEVSQLKTSLVQKQSALDSALLDVQTQREALVKEIDVKQKELASIQTDIDGIFASAKDKESQAQAKIDEYTILLSNVTELQAKLAESVKAITGV